MSRFSEIDLNPNAPGAGGLSMNDPRSLRAHSKYSRRVGLGISRTSWSASTGKPESFAPSIDTGTFGSRMTSFSGVRWSRTCVRIAVGCGSRCFTTARLSSSFASNSSGMPSEMTPSLSGSTSPGGSCNSTGSASTSNSWPRPSDAK